MRLPQPTAILLEKCVPKNKHILTKKKNKGRKREAVCSSIPTDVGSPITLM